MTDHLKPLTVGDKLPTDKRTWNPLLELARKPNAQRPAFEKNKPVHRNAITFRFINETGYDLDRFNFIALGETWLDIESPEFEFGDPVLMGILPEWETPVACVLKPTIDGEPGEAMIAGVTQALVDVDDLEHEFAKPINGNYLNLQSTRYPTSIRILAKPDSIGDDSPCVIQLGYVEPTSIGWVQAPPQGIPAMTPEGNPGKVNCELLIRSPQSGPNVQEGQLVKTGEFVSVSNYEDEDAGVGGNGKVKIVKKGTTYIVLTWNCKPVGSATDFFELPLPTQNQNGGGGGAS